MDDSRDSKKAGYWLAGVRGITSDVKLVAAVLLCVASVLVFLLIWDEVVEGDTQATDEWILRSLRRTDDPAMPIGPAWLRESALDATALGSVFVLSLTIAAIVGFMWIRGNHRTAWTTLSIAGSGAAATFVIKNLLGRDRPDAVPHLREVTTPSFPSGHAALSAVVFLTLGLLLAGTMKGRATRFYCVAWALFLSFLVGVSRVYLGVHYPTDVLGGWTFGLAWALAGWSIARRMGGKGTPA